MSTPKYRSNDQRILVVNAVKYLLNIEGGSRLFSIETLDLIRQSYIDLADPEDTPVSARRFKEDTNE